MKVQDVMTTNPVTISPDDIVFNAIAIINKYHIWTLLIVSEEKIIGVLTKQDIKNRMIEPNQKVSEIMSTPAYTISPDEELSVATEKLKSLRINALTVVEGMKVVGILTRSDIYKKSLQKYSTCHYCYPRGDREKKELTQCNYCKNWFCKDHFIPKKPMPPPFGSTNIDERSAWEVKGGHPCVSYADYLIKYGEPTKLTNPKIEFRPTTKITWEPPIEVETPIEPIPFSSKKKPLNEYPNRFIRWFNWKKHPRNHLRKKQFLTYLIILIIISIAFWYVYSTLKSVKPTVLSSIKIGSLIEIILLILFIYFLYKLLVNLRYGIRGLTNGLKLITFVVFLIFCFQIYQHPGVITNPIVQFNYDTLNPIQIDLDSNGSIATTYDNNNGNSLPTATASAMPETGTAPLTVYFLGSGIDHDGTIVSYNWNFGDGNTSTEETPSHTFQSSNTYTVTFTVEDNDGAKTTETLTVTVNQPFSNQKPTLSLSASTNSGDAPFTATFILKANDQDGSISSWTLDINNDGTSEYSGSGIPPSPKQHTYTNAGTYLVKFTATDNEGTTNYDTITITVNEKSNDVPIDNVPPDYNPSDTFSTNPKSITLSYIYNAEWGQIEYTVYKGLNDYLASLPRSLPYGATKKDFILRDLNQEDQKEFLIPLVQKIQDITYNIDGQAKIAISIVQNIPYDYDAYYSNDITGKYPYEVFYTQTGVCGEKSELLVFLLRELGYGVATFEYSNHRAVGVQCPIEYSYDGTGYCFVESTAPSIITDSNLDYVGTGKLGSYTMIKIADGKSLDDISEEYNDAKEYNRLKDLAAASGGILYDPSDYNEWKSLVEKYGIQTS
jgi:PKD repeat protein